MRWVVTRGRLFWVIGGLALVLAGALVAEALPVGGDPSTGADISAAAVPVAASTAPAAPPIDDWVNVALGRPLFAPDRRPDAAATAPHGALPRLSGTIRFAETSLAIFQPATAVGAAKSMVVGEGANLSGWTITDIKDGSVTLMRNGRIATLRLSYANLPVLPHRLATVAVRVLHDKRSNVFFQP